MDGLMAGGGVEEGGRRGAQGERYQPRVDTEMDEWYSGERDTFVSVGYVTEWMEVWIVKWLC